MRLERVKLENFRQHQATELVLGPGITGIIGPNGAGKSTILEAIAWAIYGNPAARGKVESIRFARAKPRTSVRAEVDFTLGRHEYRVWRTLRDAELLKDGRPIANSLTAVTEQLTRLFGMSRPEFFNTYFTGQKELAVMAAMGSAERGRFLSRLLGYERLRMAQERLRERRSVLRGELQGLEAGLPDAASLAVERSAAEAALAHARADDAAATTRRDRATCALREREPLWRELEGRRETMLSLEGERRMAEAAVKTAQQEFDRLDRELAHALQAKEALVALGERLAPFPGLRRELDALDDDARLDGVRREWRAQRQELESSLRALDAKLAEAAQVGRELEQAGGAHEAARGALEQSTRLLSERRTAWVRDRQDAETKRQAYRDQYRDAKEQWDRIRELGPEGTCPTCKRPLGTHYEEALGLLERQLEEIEINGKFFRQRLEQLEAEPPEVAEAEAERLRLETEARAATERLATLRARLEERQALLAEREGAQARVAELAERLALEPVQYDPARHDEVRRAVRALEPVAQEAARLAERAGRAEPLVAEAERAEQELSVRERRVREFAEAVRALGFDERQYAAARSGYDDASAELKASEIALAGARERVTGAEREVRQVERREREREERVRRLDEVTRDVRLHNELDRAFGDLRGELNAQVRPELSDIASSFLDDLTDGRYTELVLDEDYRLTILEDGAPKPVISGGEEDVANLVLRLAISQLVAERAGQPLALLVLDEIFGSLDESRRHHVVDLLRRLRDRFEQVILITHIESVREGLDRVIRVAYEPTTGASVVTDDMPLDGMADDEDVAA